MRSGSSGVALFSTQVRTAVLAAARQAAIAALAWKSARRPSARVSPPEWPSGEARSRCSRSTGVVTMSVVWASSATRLVAVVGLLQPVQQRRADPRGEGQVQGLFEQGGDQGIVAVGQGHVLLGGEIAEERHVPRRPPRPRSARRWWRHTFLRGTAAGSTAPDALTRGGLLARFAANPAGGRNRHTCHRRASASAAAAAGACDRAGPAEAARPGRYRRLVRAARAAIPAQISITVLMFVQEGAARGGPQGAPRREVPGELGGLGDGRARAMAASRTGRASSAGPRARV